MQNTVLNNRVKISGVVDSEVMFSHEVCKEEFYKFYLKVPRLSDVSDRIVITIPKRYMDGRIIEGEFVYVEGQFRSYNNVSGFGNKLLLTVFAKNIYIADNLEFVNEIQLNGFICKPPIYRTTPFGREITDILLATNRQYNKSDYIPCIAWGKNARVAREFNVGDNIKIYGRIQSREYQKKYTETDIETKTAYEVSVSKIDYE